jgi:hypothetical protein
MQWNFKDIGFLHAPEVFMGSFDNEKMQARHEELKKIKLNALRQAVENEQDPLKAMMRLDKKDRVRFLYNNTQAFNDAGRFEEAVLKLYRINNSPFSTGGEFVVWKDLFQSCSPKRLYALGTPITFTTAAVYRISVTGTEESLSWTLSRERVKGFAKRWYEQKIGNGRIYTMDVARENILVYLTDHQEEEVVLNPDFMLTAMIRELPPLSVIS